MLRNHAEKAPYARRTYNAVAMARSDSLNVRQLPQSANRLAHNIRQRGVPRWGNRDVHGHYDQIRPGPKGLSYVTELCFRTA